MSLKVLAPLSDATGLGASIGTEDDVVGVFGASLTTTETPSVIFFDGVVGCEEVSATDVVRS